MNEFSAAAVTAAHREQWTREPERTRPYRRHVRTIRRERRRFRFGR